MPTGFVDKVVGIWVWRSVVGVRVISAQAGGIGVLTKHTEPYKYSSM